jgi:hypothetical protein
MPTTDNYGTGLPCVGDKMRQRTYIRVYENRLETNWPWSPFLCWSTNRCMIDHSAIYYFDKYPNRVGMCCLCIPCLCCGQPVIYTSSPECCCIDCSSCCGETIKYAPCDCCELRNCVVCGPPCYDSCSSPLLWPLKNSASFLASYKGAVDAYAVRNKLKTNEMARFPNMHASSIVPAAEVMADREEE